MKVQTDCLMSEMMRVQTDCFSIIVIVISFILSESLDFEKKVIERRLMSLLKNLFLINLSTFCLLIFSIILMIQISVFLKTLFSDSSKFLFLISAFLNFFDVMPADLLISLVSQNMCLCCSK